MVDGICGVQTWDAIMSDSVPHYALKPGFQGVGIRMRSTVCITSVIPTDALDVNGTYDETTVEAMKKLQAERIQNADGVYGTATYNLLYSDTKSAQHRPR